MLHPSTQKLIDRLADMTAREQLDWVGGSEGAPECTRAGYTMVLGANPSVFLIRNDEGREVERVGEGELLTTRDISGSTYLEVFAALRADALRVVRMGQHVPSGTDAPSGTAGTTMHENSKLSLDVAMEALRRAKGIKVLTGDEASRTATVTRLTRKVSDT